METLRTAVSALSFSDPAEDAIDRANEHRKAVALIAQLPTIIARYERRRRGEPPSRRTPSLGYAENFLPMLRGEAPTAGGGARVRGRDDPPRRARDERLDVHRARRRRHERRHALRDRRRDLRAEGAAARRRQPGGDGDARGVRLAGPASPRASARGSRRSSRSTASAIRSTARWTRARRSCAGSPSSSRGRRRARLPRARSGGRARGARAEGPLAERRPLLRRRSTTTSASRPTSSSRSSR